MEVTLRTACFWCTNWFNYFGQQFAIAEENQTCARPVAQQSSSWGYTLGQHCTGAPRGHTQAALLLRAENRKWLKHPPTVGKISGLW